MRRKLLYAVEDYLEWQSCERIVEEGRASWRSDQYMAANAFVQFTRHAFVYRALARLLCWKLST